MFFSDENGICHEICKVFSYHGIDLVSVIKGDSNIEVFEPAYGIKVRQYDSSVNIEKIRESLDDLSSRLRICRNEKNILPAITYTIITNGKMSQNESFNMEFIDKVENMRMTVKKSNREKHIPWNSFCNILNEVFDEIKG